MDIRARLLIAFSPLLILLLGLVGALPLIQAQAQATLERQIAATDDLFDNQALELSVLREHDAVKHIAEGEIDENAVRLQAIRSEIRELLARQEELADPSQELDVQLGTAYARLAALHDEVIAAAEAGDQAGAAELFARPEIDQTIDALLALSLEARGVNRQALEAVNAEALLSQQRTFALIAAALTAGVIVALALSWLFLLPIVRQIDRLAADAERYSGGDMAGQLSPGGSIRQLRRLRDSFQLLLDANSARQQRLQASLAELEERVRREDSLARTVQALSLPVVQLRHDTLLLPLIGYLDDERAQELTRGLLEAIQARRARMVVVDLTGLADLDAATAARLRRAAAAARLLGARVTLVGVRAEQALPLAETNLAAEKIEIARDIAAVLSGPG